MSYADQIFIENCKDILAHGVWDTDLPVRPRWEDGSPAHTVKRFGIVDRYDLAAEFPVQTIRKMAFKRALDELLRIWKKKSSDIHDLGSHIWDAWADESGSIGKAYGYQLGVKHHYREGDFDQVDRVLYDLKHDKPRRVDTPYRPMDICCRALDAGFLIDLPVLKGHCQTAMTCALKNCKGCLPDREKRRFHSEGLMEPIAALAAALRPALTIVDSICGDLDFEEGGNPVYTGRMLLGTDPVQIDAYGCKLMGLSLEDVPYIALAEGWGAGSTALDPQDLVRLNAPQAAADYPRPSGKVARLAGRVQAESACSACYASLIRALYTAGDPGGVPIAIGQGWKGRTFDGLGVGRCCDCASRQVMGCPPTAKEIAAALRG